MKNDELSYCIGQILINNGLEGPYNNVCHTTRKDRDYVTIGVSSWEGERADMVLSYIDGGDQFAHRSYTDLANAGDLEKLSALLDSPQGQEAQNIILGNDCLAYVNAQNDIASNDDSRVIIYIGSWQPTSTYLPIQFLKRRIAQGKVDIHSLKSVRDIFFNEYARAADCMEYLDGYQNRAENAYQAVAALDLSQYGVPAYGQGIYGR